MFVHVSLSHIYARVGFRSPHDNHIRRNDIVRSQGNGQLWVGASQNRKFFEVTVLIKASDAQARTGPYFVHTELPGPQVLQRQKRSLHKPRYQLLKFVARRLSCQTSFADVGL